MFKQLISAAVLAAALPAAAAATPAGIAVRHGDLNLDSAAGQARLETRIDRAARSVCGIGFGVRTLAEQAAQRSCYREARERAAVEVAALIARETRMGG